MVTHPIFPRSDYASILIRRAGWIGQAAPRADDIVTMSMFELTAANAGVWLAAHGRGSPILRVEELGGGVSNTVLRVETADGALVLKQALGKLRVQQDWFSDRRRALREADALRALAPLLPAGAIPELLMEDAENCVFAMSAAPNSARTWKSLLLAGVIEPEVAESIAVLEAAMVAASWHSPDWESRFGDLTVFDELRLDPYYRATARQHADLADFFDGLIAETRGRRAALTHGDWSPKNFLVEAGRPMAIDFEVIHYGDPSFDAAFLLNHLLLKSFHHPEWREKYLYAAQRYWGAFTSRLPSSAAWFEDATLAHLGGLMLARVDGKSPAEYLGCESRERVRGFARELILKRPRTIEEAFERRRACA